MYTVLQNPLTGKTTGVYRLADGANIPMSTANADWRDFLAWNATQTTPLDLSDRLPPPRREVRPFADVVADIQALNSTDRDKLLAAVCAAFLQTRPGFARDMGISLDGDQPSR